MPVAAQVRADDEAGVDEKRGDSVPCGMRTRMAVQQHHRPPLTATPDAQRHLANVDVLERKAFEHKVPLPSARG